MLWFFFELLLRGTLVYLWIPHLLLCSTNVRVRRDQPLRIHHYWMSNTLFSTGGWKGNKMIRIEWSKRFIRYILEPFSRPSSKGKLKYLLNSWTLMKEKICINTLRTKNGGTWKIQKKTSMSPVHCTLEKQTCCGLQMPPIHLKSSGGTLLTWFAFRVSKKFPRLFTIPCQWAIKVCCAAVFATERDAPLTKLALDVLGA